MSSKEYSGPDRHRPGSDDRTVEKTTILLVDDHTLFRVGVRQILEREPGFDIVGEADDTRSAFDLAVQLSPDIILMDLSLPAPGGIETTLSSTPSKPVRPHSSSRTWRPTIWSR
jgi:PleD family two-component response regulator